MKPIHLLSRLFPVLMLFASAASAQSMVERFSEGSDYFRIDPPLPATAAQGRIEVLEAFSYGCIHCAHFQPQVDAWLKRKPADVVMTYLPATFRPDFALFARGYYAAESMGLLTRTHQPVYDALWVRNQRIASRDDLVSLYAGLGADRAKFLAAMESPSVATQLSKAHETMMRAGIDGTPSVIVAGKYRLTPTSAGGYEQVFAIVDFLIDRERRARKR
jgi:thiol:disulfide interchange protein DsbA